MRETVAYYEGRCPGLGARFKRTFYRAIDDLLAWPEQHAVKAEAEIRTRLLRPFPYLVFYAVESGAVFVLAVQYAGRRPSVLEAIMQERRTS